jgi:hypothetical protein
VLNGPTRPAFCDQIDNAVVWRIVDADLPPLRRRIADLLVELGGP